MQSGAPFPGRSIPFLITPGPRSARIACLAEHDIGADDDAGIWDNGSFDLDLSTKIKAPATYQLRFVGQGGPAEVAELDLLVGGVPAPHLVRGVPKRPDLRMITIPEVGKPIRLRGQVSGVLRGNVLVRRT